MAYDLSKLEVGEDGIHPHAGVPDGFVDHNGETVVYVYDDEGNYLGFKKIPKEPHDG